MSTSGGFEIGVTVSLGSCGAPWGAIVKTATLAEVV